jgi:hypothetical protein
LQAGAFFGENGASYVPSEPLLPLILKEARTRHLAMWKLTEPPHIQQPIACHLIPPRDLAIVNAEPPIASIFLTFPRTSFSSSPVIYRCLHVTYRLHS